MEDRGEYKKCDLCDMHLWEAHAAKNEKHSHLCTPCFLQIPKPDYTEALKEFRKKIKQLEDEENKRGKK